MCASDWGWDWLPWDRWDDVQLSINWANIATVTVAIAAIIVSSRFNVLTLRRNEAQFRQQRHDAVTHRLRGEISAFVGAVFDRVPLGTLMDPVAEAERTEASASAAKTVLLRGLPDGLAVRDSYNRIGNRGVGILMLTGDETINRLILQINDDIRAEKDDFYSLSKIFTDTSEPGIDLVANAQTQRVRRKQRDEAIFNATTELLAYCVTNLRLV